MRTRWVLTTSVYAGDENVDTSFNERRLKKLEDKKLELTGLRQKYDHLINIDADEIAKNKSKNDKIAKDNKDSYDKRLKDYEDWLKKMHNAFLYGEGEQLTQEQKDELGL